MNVIEATQAERSVLPDVLDRQAFERRLGMAVKMAGYMRGGAALILLSIPRSGVPENRWCYANAIRCSVRLTDCVAWFGDDCFAVLLDADSVQTAQRGTAKICAALVDACAVPEPLAGGLAMFPVHAGDTAGLLDAAAEALRQALEQGGGVVTAEPGAFPAEVLHQRLAQRMGEALQHDEFVACFQPVVSLRTGLPVAVEALARWQHPDLGMLDASEFMALADDAAHVDIFNLRMLNRALDQLASWQASGMPIRVSVNLSARMLERADLERRVSDRLAAAGISSSSLTLELRDDALPRLSATARQTLFALAGAGIGLCIDDFGRGEASLFVLNDLPVDVIKLDVRLSAGACRKAADARVLETLLAFGYKLGKQVIAKGIEHAGMRDRLVALGCEFGQGYHYAKALSAQEFERWQQAQRAGL